jgi:uncharacterized protein
MRSFINQQLYPGEFLLHKKYCQSEMLLDLVWTHSNIVVDIAMQLYENGRFPTEDLPREFVVQAGLLFDIGMYMCSGFEHFPGQPAMERPYIQHGLIGAWILEREGYSPAVIQVAHAHMGVGLTQDDIRLYGIELPIADYLAHTKLQQLIMYASKFHSKTPRLKTKEEIEASLKKYGNDKVQLFQEMALYFGDPDMVTIAKKYEDWHKGFEFQLSHIEGGNSLPAASVTAALNSAGVIGR